MAEKIIIPGRPITKKNSSQIILVQGRPRIIPSKQYKKYEQDAGHFIKCKDKDIREPINLKCIYYMPTKHRVDLVNLIEATCDLLVHYHVLADDNSSIVVSHDGSRVLYDKQEPRAEIYIEELKT